jgi:hypothetical protein
MTSFKSVGGRHLAIPLLAFGMSACAGMGTIGDILAAGTGLGGGEVSGEIRSIDTRRQEIEIHNGWGRTDRLRYDNRTRVVYQQRNYSVRDLERGDVVRARVNPDRNGRLHTDYIVVQRSVQDNRGTGSTRARIERLDGTIARIDTQRGWFELQQSRGGVLLVTLPYEPRRADRDRFRRLRRGDRVRIEAEILNSSRAELRRFL